MPTQTRVPTGDHPSIIQFDQFSPPNYVRVDEYPSTDDGDYNLTLTAYSPYSDDIFSFTAFSIPSGSTINSVKVYVRGKITSGTHAYLGAILRIDGVTHRLFGQNYTTSFSENIFTFSTNPATSIAWTVDQVNGIGTGGIDYFGYSSEFHVDYASYCSRVYIEVNYEEPNLFPMPCRNPA